MLRQLTVRRVLHASAIDRILSTRTLCPALLLRFLHQRQGRAGAAGCGLHPNGLLRFAPSIRCRQHPSPGGRHLFPAPGAAGSWLAASRPPRASYRSAPERVSSHAASFGHMMPGRSGPTTMSTWPSVPPETVTTSRSALETTSSRASADSGVQGHRQCGPGRGPGRSARHQPRRHRSGVHRERACWPGPGP
jgi:hypothetical protein